MTETFFKDLTVVELAGVLAGPSVGMFFSEMGARVIKIENKKTGGDVTRSWKQYNEDENSSVSAYFSSVNYRKEYRFADLNHAEDLRMVKDLIAGADIVLSNFAAGKDERYGLDYESLKKIKPDIVFGHITGFGEDSKRVAYDIVLQAEAGLLYMNGEPGRNPVKLPVALVDILAAHQLKEGLLIAWMRKLKTGEGAHVHVSLYDAALSCLTNQASNYLMNELVPQPMGTLHPNIAPYGEIVESADGVKYVLAVGSDQQFTHLCRIIQKEDMAAMPEYGSNKNRVINRASLLNGLQQGFSQLPAADIEKQLLSAGIPFGRIRKMNEVFSDANAMQDVLCENIEGRETKRVKSVMFSIR